MKRVVVIGGGISGLSLAYRLEERLPDAEVLVLEQSSRPGGTIETVRRDGFTVEAGPNGFPDNNPSTLDLARSVGLGDRLQAASDSASKNRFLLLDEHLRKLPSSLVTFLTSRLLIQYLRNYFHSDKTMTRFYQTTKLNKTICRTRNIMK